MEKRRVISTDVEKIEVRLFNFFSELLERSNGEQTGRENTGPSSDKSYKSIWEFWDKEL